MKKIFEIFLALAISNQAPAVIFLDTGDPQHNTSTPGDNSGWQYEGKFNNVLGVPIAPLFFISAKHTGGIVGDAFNFHGDSYMTVAFHDVTATDLRIWKVNPAKPFPTYAPLSSGISDIGGIATVIGRGTQRGSQILLASVPKGWGWAAEDLVQRWGRNVVEGTTPGGASIGELLYCDFNNPGITEECHLSRWDSGGGLFVLEDGLWRLAGINYAVDGPIRVPPAILETKGAYFDLGGLEYYEDPDWILITDTEDDKPSSFYCSRISAHLLGEDPEDPNDGILKITGGDGSLAPESYSAWQTLYFTPAEISNTAITGSTADYDSDGIANLLEYALNLEPGFNARTTMTAASGLSGLPLVRLENISGSDHLTMEFVRRTVGSGSGLTYIPQFASDFDNWLEVGAETVTPINPRWERVMVVDPQVASGNEKRFARLKVSVED